jgi:hypothetical protein
VPRYFFHVYEDLVAEDDEGIELPDVDAARDEAIRAGRELIAAQVAGGRLRLFHRIEVLDERGRTVLAIPYREMVEIEG